MISLLDQLPIITYSHGESFCFHSSWLQKEIERNAKKAGLYPFPLARELVITLEAYLRYDYKEDSISFEELEKKIQSLLFSLQFPTLASSFLLQSPPSSFSLLVLAQEAGAQYELLFFQLLKKHLLFFMDSPVHCIELHDLEASLQFLYLQEKKKRESLRLQIIDFISTVCEKLLSSSREKPLHIKIS